MLLTFLPRSSDAETAVPYTMFKAIDYEVRFATEAGIAPRCDKKMLQGLTQKLLGAKKDVVALYKKMAASDEMRHPLAWSDPAFSLDPFDVVVLPGGHDKAMRQIIESAALHRHLLAYFPQTKKPGGRKVVAAICHGVMVLANAREAEGRSVIRDCLTTTLPAKMEQAAYWGTRAFLGDYYKTYGAGSEDVEQSVGPRIMPCPWILRTIVHANGIISYAGHQGSGPSCPVQE